MASYVPDAESNALGEVYAVVQTTRKGRKRFPEASTRVLASAAEALALADAGRGEYPALVYGPSKSSEGVKLYYLVRWLD